MEKRFLLAFAVLCLTTPAAAVDGADVVFEDTVERVGPFALGPVNLPQQRYTVVLHGKRIVGSDGPDTQALASLEIQDAKGVVLHRESFPWRVEQGSFAESCSASVGPLAGNVAAGLLISAGCLPSAPDSGDTWEIFGVVNGKLVRFGKPFTTQGTLLGLVPTPVRRSGKAVLIQPDVLQFKVWTGNVRVTVPVRVDWMQGRLGQGLRCFEQTGHGMREGGCELPVEAERLPVEDDPTFVRLFADAGGTGVPRHIVVTKSSLVEIVSAKVGLVWDESGEVIFFGVEERDPWLEIRIDGKEGWIHTQEDFDAIGLPLAG